jgi:hypothetical protein
VWVTRWGGFNLGYPFWCYDNLSNSYTTAFEYYGVGGSDKIHAALFYANNINGGTLNNIGIGFAGIGSVAYHVSGCSAEFTDALTYNTYTMDRSNPSQVTTFSTPPVTLANSLIFYGASVGGDGENGGGTGFVQPSGFSIASSRLVAGAAPSPFLCYKYGSLSATVLTSSWTGARYFADIRGSAVSWFPPTTSMYLVLDE